MVTYGLKLLVPGLVAGIILSLALRSVVASYLFGVSTTYVLVYLAVILLLSLIAMIATLGPAMNFCQMLGMEDLRRRLGEPPLVVRL
jgi:hypothetical protein